MAKMTIEQVRAHAAKNSLPLPPGLEPSLRHVPGLHCDKCAKIPIFEGFGGQCGCGGTFKMVEGPSAEPPKAPIPAGAASTARPATILSKIPGQDSGKTVPAKPRRAKEPNRTEREYEMMLKASFPAAIVKWEAYTLRLASRVNYTPDFSVLHPSGELEFFEVKGPYIWPKAMVKLRMAAEQFDHPFTLAQKLKSGWEITSIVGRRK